MTTRLRSESGQALGITALFVVVLIGAVALTIDVGSWYRERRQAQTTADAAALSAAQALPNSVTATTLAQNYAAKNGGGINAVNGISFRSDLTTDGSFDTVVIKVTRTAPGFFSKLFSIDSTQVHAAATARIRTPSSVWGAAPIVVNVTHQYLSGTVNGKQCPCFDSDTTIPLGKDGAPGSFTLVDLTDYTQADKNGACPPGDSGGNTGSKTVGTWVQQGYQGWLQLGCYDNDSGAKFSDNPIGDALTIRKGSVLLFPIYDTLTGTGSTANYHIIGWAAFQVSAFSASGNSGSISGQFKNVIWDGIQSSSGPNQPNYGVRSIALVN